MVKKCVKGDTNNKNIKHSHHRTTGHILKYI
jgi:hypothetical protein